MSRRSSTVERRIRNAIWAILGKSLIWRVLVQLTNSKGLALIAKTDHYFHYSHGLIHFAPI